MQASEREAAAGDDAGNASGITRRAVMQTGAAIAALGAAGAAAAQSVPASVPAEGATGADAAGELPPQLMKITLVINGQKHALEVDTRTTLLDALRENLQLNGTKKGCDHGQCGACTVLLEGRRTNSCLTLAVMHDGQQLTTVEGLARGDELHPMQAAFIKHDGFQCGYCTPGQICSSIGMLGELRRGMPSHVTQDLQSRDIALSDEEIRERMSGNLCRCSAYPNIVAAIKEVAGART